MRFEVCRGGKRGNREGEQGQRKLVWRHIGVYTSFSGSVTLRFSASFFALFTVFLSHSRCPSSLSLSSSLLSCVFPLWWSLLSRDLISRCLYFLSETDSLPFVHSCVLCVRSHYDQHRGRGRYVAELRAARVKETQERRSEGKGASCFQLRGFVISLWSANLWQSAFQGDVFFFIHV